LALGRKNAKVFNVSIEIDLFTKEPFVMPTTDSTFNGGKIENPQERFYQTQLDTINRDTLSAWYEALLTLLKSQGSHTQPLRFLHDFQQGTLIPAVRQRAMELYTTGKTLPITTRTAFVVQAGQERELDVFANMTSSDTKHRVRIFTDIALAQTWLDETH